MPKPFAHGYPPALDGIGPVAIMDADCALCSFGARMIHRLDRSGTIRTAQFRRRVAKRPFSISGWTRATQTVGCFWRMVRPGPILTQWLRSGDVVADGGGSLRR